MRPNCFESSGSDCVAERDKRPATGIRIAVLWRSILPGHNACFRALAAMPGVEMYVCFPRPPESAPTDMRLYSWMTNSYSYEGLSSAAGRVSHYLSSGGIDEDRLKRDLEAFEPDVFLVNSWHVPAYRRVLRRYRDKIRVLRIDNQWTGSFRQRVGAAVAGTYIHVLYDAVLVPGERQVRFAKNIGFRDNQLWRGSQTCDHDQFAAVYQAVRRGEGQYQEAFLFVGRLVEDKGVHHLAAAYRKYRASVADPWPLLVCGIGPLAELLDGQPGVEVRKFVQPDELPEVFARASCLVLPSTYEPWGLVVNEATAAGLAVICTERVGAAVHLVQDRFNGYLFETGDVDDLADALIRYDRLSDEQRRTMSERSYMLSLQFTPALFAEQFYSRSRELLEKRQRAAGIDH